MSSMVPKIFPNSRLRLSCWFQVYSRGCNAIHIVNETIIDLLSIHCKMMSIHDNQCLKHCLFLRNNLYQAIFKRKNTVGTKLLTVRHRHLNRRLLSVFFYSRRLISKSRPNRIFATEFVQKRNKNNEEASLKNMHVFVLSFLDFLQCSEISTSGDNR